MHVTTVKSWSRLFYVNSKKILALIGDFSILSLRSQAKKDTMNTFYSYFHCVFVCVHDGKYIYATVVLLSLARKMYATCV